MKIKSGTFDKAKAIMYLDREQKTLAARVLALESAAPSATMDAAKKGATLDKLPKRLQSKLEAAGFITPHVLGQMTDEELLTIDGVGQAAVKLIRGLD